MVFVPPKDRVVERSTSNSQTVFAVTGAIDTSYNAFSAHMSVADTTLGAVVEPGVAFKSGLLTYSATNEVTVTTAYETKGTFSSGGTKEVFMGLPALRAMIDRIGMFFWDTQSAARDGALIANGAAVSRTTYAMLWAFVQASGNLAASEGAKQAGQYGPGDGSTTFTLLDLTTAGRFIRAFISGTFGAAQADAFQGHKHSLAESLTPAAYDQIEPGGAPGNQGARLQTAQAVGNPTTDGTNGTPRTAAETRPINVSLLPCIWYK